MSKVFHWLSTGFKYSSTIERVIIIVDLIMLAYFLPANPVRDYPAIYLWATLLVFDFVLLYSHGTATSFLKSRNSCAPNPSTKVEPWPLLYSAASIICHAIFIVAIMAQYAGIIPFWIAHIIYCLAVICNSSYAMAAVLTSMNTHNVEWLAGAKGHIGAPNWISVTRMSVALIIPYIYDANPFGEMSPTIATFAFAIAVATDALDGMIARSCHLTTKAGKALDPLCDKIIIYPVAAGFVIATGGNMFSPNNAFVSGLVYLCIGLMLAREILFSIWFFKHYHKLKNGIGASIVDKVRMFAMCAWVGSMALAITIGGDSFFVKSMILLSFVSVLATAILSIISVYVDVRRVRHILAEDES